MDDYLTVKELGNGSFGTVMQAQHKSTGQMVAIKRMKKKFSSWDKVCELREFKALRNLPSQSSIISLLEAFLIPQTRELYFVFEYMEGNLYQLIKDRRGKIMKEKIVQSITFQILEGLYFIHSHGIFHRDMKPENILISTRKKKCDDNYVIQEDNKDNQTEDIKDISDDDEYIVKIGDFGLAREIKSKSPYTDYVSTRWYRAPEVLLRSNSYSSPIDLWAVGTILAELFTLDPLFPGYSEIDQLFTISKILGSPSVKSELSIQDDKIGGGEWKEGIKLAKTMGFSFPQTPPQPLSNIFPQSTSSYFLELLSQLLRYDPKQRLTAFDALKHPYFTEDNLIFTPPNELEEIKLNKGMEKKKKNDSFLFKRNFPGNKKNNNRYTWTKGTDGQNKKNGHASHLCPLDIDAANIVRQEEFILPTIKTTSPLSSEKAYQINEFGDKPEYIEQNIIKSHQVREHGTIMEEECEHEKTLSKSRPCTANWNEEIERYFGEKLSTENIKSIPITCSERDHDSNDVNNVDVSSMHKSYLSKSFQFPSMHKNVTSEIDQIIKEIEDMNRGPGLSKIDCNESVSPKTVDLRRYQLPDDVMKFFGTADDSSPVLRRSSSRQRDFMKAHRRYSSISEMSSKSFDFQHQKKPSAASSQDHSRNDSGFSTNSTNKTSLEDEKEVPSYATKVYGQHLKTWQQICQEYRISLHDSPFADENFGMIMNDTSKSPVIPEFRIGDVSKNNTTLVQQESVIPEFRVSNISKNNNIQQESLAHEFRISDISRNNNTTRVQQESVIPKLQFSDVSRNNTTQVQQASPTSANNSFFSNLKAAVKSHTVSPTKRYGIFSSNHENAPTSLGQQSTQQSLKSQPRLKRSKSNSGMMGAKPAITKKRSFIFDSTSVVANSLFSSKDDGAMKESKRNAGGEKKDKKLSSPRLFATLGAKFPGGKGGDSTGFSDI